MMIINKGTLLIYLNDLCLRDLPGNEWKYVYFLFRKTVLFGKEEDTIKPFQFQSQAGLCKTTVYAVEKSLKEKGVLAGEVADIKRKTGKIRSRLQRPLIQKDGYYYTFLYENLIENGFEKVKIVPSKKEKKVRNAP